MARKKRSIGAQIVALFEQLKKEKPDQAQLVLELIKQGPEGAQAKTPTAKPKPIDPQGKPRSGPPVHIGSPGTGGIAI